MVDQPLLGESLVGDSMSESVYVTDPRLLKPRRLSGKPCDLVFDLAELEQHIKNLEAAKNQCDSNADVPEEVRADFKKYFNNKLPVLVLARDVLLRVAHGQEDFGNGSICNFSRAVHNEVILPLVNKILDWVATTRTTVKTKGKR